MIDTSNQPNKPQGLTNFDKTKKSIKASREDQAKESIFISDDNKKKLFKNFDGQDHSNSLVKNRNKSWFERSFKYLVTEDASLISDRSRRVIDFLFDKLPSMSAKLAAASNFLGGILELFPVSKSIVKTVENITTKITQFSFIPYGARGVINGIRKNNFFQAIAFLGEPISAFMGNLKDIYLLRGLATGMDQLPVATENITKKTFGSVGFKSMKDSIVHVPKAIWQLLTEVVADPVGTLFSMKPKGHAALISSLGSMAASVGYFITKNESFFGPLRDISAVFIDWEMLFNERPRLRVAGVLFMLEEAFDFLARYAGGFRLFMNQCAHGFGRLALDNYIENYNDELQEERARKQEMKAKETALV